MRTTASRQGGTTQEESPLIKLPVEILLQVLDYLLVCPDPIFISPVKFPAWKDTPPKEKRKKITPRKQQVYQHPPRLARDRMPHVGILAANRKLNDCGLGILYGKNEFIIGHILGGAKDLPFLESHFFFCHMRQTTVDKIKHSMSIVPACGCKRWFSASSLPSNMENGYTIKGKDFIDLLRDKMRRLRWNNPPGKRPRAALLKGGSTRWILPHHAKYLHQQIEREMWAAFPGAPTPPYQCQDYDCLVTDPVPIWPLLGTVIRFMLAVLYCIAVLFAIAALFALFALFYFLHHVVL